MTLVLLTVIRQKWYSRQFIFKKRLLVKKLIFTFSQIYMHKSYYVLIVWAHMLICFHNMSRCLIYRGVGWNVQKVIEGWSLRFFCKNGCEIDIREVVYSKYCFSLVMYEFCSNNSLYSVSIPFTIFVIPFDTIGCYQISYKASIAY